MAASNESVKHRTSPLPFVLLTFGSSWFIWLLALGLPSEKSAIALLGDVTIHVSLQASANLIGTLVPGLVALVLLARRGGRETLGNLWRDLTRWRVQVGYYLLALFLPLLVGFLAKIGHVLTGGDVTIVGPAFLVLTNFLLNIPQSPLWEEIGWRGYLLPLLQERRSGLDASLILGLVWGIWHVPLHMGSGRFGFAQFLLFLTYTTALSVVMTWLYNRTGRALPIIILLHSSTNILSKTLSASTLGDQLWMYLWVCGLMWVAAFVIIAASGFSLAKPSESETTVRPAP
jgi:membrane protease YdiL (CAAX protease family)